MVLKMRMPKYLIVTLAICTLTVAGLCYAGMTITGLDTVISFFYNRGTGNAQGLLFDDEGLPRINSHEYLYSIAEGYVPNHTLWTKSGYNAALSASEETLWAAGGDYIFPTTAMRMEIYSTSADDTSNGTGARIVQINYLNSTFAEKVENVTLNGTTAVPTVATDIYRINNLRVRTVGTGNKNAGDIDIRHLDDTPIYSRIATGTNRAINSAYTVPINKCLYIYDIMLSAGSNVANRPVRVITQATYDNIAHEKISFFMPYTNVVIVDGSVDVPILGPTRFCSGVDIKVNAISPDGATYGAITMRGWLEDD